MQSTDARISARAAETQAPKRSVWHWLASTVFALKRADRAVLVQIAPLFAVVTAASVIVATFTKSVFLSDYDVSALPLMFLGSSVFTALVSVGYVAVVERLPLEKRFPGLIVTAQISFALLHLVYPLAPKLVALAQLVWCTGLSQLILTQTWNLSSAVLPARQGKRLFPVLAAVSTLGAATGGALVSLGLKFVEARQLLWFVLILQAFPLLRVKHIQRELSRTVMETLPEDDAAAALPGARHTASQPVRRSAGGEIGKAFRSIVETPILLRLGGLVFLLQIASLIIDFQFSTELKQRFSRDQMAGFLGQYYLVANSVSFFVALMATGRIVRLVGIGVAISASAIFVGLGSAWYFAAARLDLGSPFWAIVATAFVERIFQFALTRNAMQMLVAPLDAKKGERAKTLIDGVIYRVATAGTSLVLLLVKPSSAGLALLSPPTLAACIGVVLIGLSINPHYRRALFEGLRARRVDSDVDPQTRALLMRSAVGEVRQRLQSGQVKEMLAALDIIRESKLPVAMADVAPLLGHRDDELCRRGLELCNELGLRPPVASLQALLQADRSPAVLREVLRSLTTETDKQLMPLVSPLVHHEDLGVARLAHMWIKRVGGDMTALEVQRQLRDDLASPSAERRARAAYISGGYSLEPGLDLSRMVHDPSPAVRQNAVLSMGQIGSPEYIDPLIDCLGRGDLVQPASQALYRYGGPLIAAVRDRLQDRPPNPAIQLRLLRIIERFGTNEAVAFLMAQAEAPANLVRNNAILSLWRLARDPDAPRPPQMWIKRRIIGEIELLRRYQALEQLAGGTSLRHVFFLSELQTMRLSAEMRAFRLLGLVLSRAALHRAYLHYRSPQQRVRSNAVELLDQHIVDPELKPFVALVERAESAPGLQGPTETPVPGVDLHAADMQALLALVEPWLGRVWHWARRRQGGEMSRDPMDMVFLLKGVPLLSDLSGEQLLPVADIVQQVHVEAGDLVFAEGQPGNHLYVILEGAVDVLRGEEAVAKLGVKECFGEMALLDSSPRSASVRARKDCELLAISRDDFQDLLDMHPALARGVIRVLTQRLRHATEQVAHDDTPAKPS